MDKQSLPAMQKILLLIAAIMLISCDREASSPYAKGLSLLGNDNAAAEKAFLLAIATNDNAGLAWLEYADLCSEQPHKLPLAIFYYRLYLESFPNDENAQAISQKLSSLEKKLASSLNQKMGDEVLEENSLRIKMLEQHSLRQKQWIDELSTENLKLRRQIAEAQKQQQK